MDRKTRGFSDGTARRLFSGLWVPTLAVLVAAAVAPAHLRAAGAGTASLTVTASDSDPCMGGSGPADRDITITLRTPSGALREQRRSQIWGDGVWYTCFRESPNQHDRIVLRVGATRRAVQFPRLKVSADRTTDRIDGRGPPDARLHLTVERYATPDDPYTTTVRTGSDGRFSIDLTDSFDLKGGPRVTLTRRTPSGDAFSAVFGLPVLVVSIQRSYVFGGGGRAGVLVEAVLEAPDGRVRARAQAANVRDAYEVSFYAPLRSADGEPVYPQPGDRLTASIAADAVLDIPVTTVRADASSNVIWGRCMPHAPYYAATGDAIVEGRTDDAGRFRRTASEDVQLSDYDSVFLQCRYETGDILVHSGVIVP